MKWKEKGTFYSLPFFSASLILLPLSVQQLIMGEWAYHTSNFQTLPKPTFQNKVGTFFKTGQMEKHIKFYVVMFNVGGIKFRKSAYKTIKPDWTLKISSVYSYWFTSRLNRVFKSLHYVVIDLHISYSSMYWILAKIHLNIFNKKKKHFIQEFGPIATDVCHLSLQTCLIICFKRCSKQRGFNYFIKTIHYISS